MEFKEYTTIFSLRKKWENLTKNKSNIYQSYMFNRLYYKYRTTSLSNIRSKNTKCKFVVGYDNGIAKCIAPLAIDKTPDKTIRLLGHGTNAGYLDYIYEEPRYAKELHDYIVKKYTQYLFDYIFVKDTSPLKDAMAVTNTFNNYAIKIFDYDQYFSGLSKSTRQNIRTAYNRLKTDEFDYEFFVYNSYEELGEKSLNLLNRLYHKRKADWQNGKIVPEKIQKKVLKRDVIYQGVRKLDNPVVAILKINHAIAAFFIGFSYRNGVCIPRLAIDTDFARYSPGMLLINEYLKDVTYQEEYILDLCRGDEKYKSFLSGQVSITYRLNNSLGGHFATQ